MEHGNQKKRVSLTGQTVSNRQDIGPGLGYNADKRWERG
jgi:hypothetical protein